MVSGLPVRSPQSLFGILVRKPTLEMGSRPSPQHRSGGHSLKLSRLVMRLGVGFRCMFAARFVCFWASEARFESSAECFLASGEFDEEWHTYDVLKLTISD